MPGVSLSPPHGLAGIIATFGDPLAALRSDGTLGPEWERDHLARAALPFPIPLSWDRTRAATAVLCHRRLVAIMIEVFAEIERSGLRAQVRTYGGCFNFRHKRSVAKLSTHAWGIAIDLNPESNRIGSRGDMDPGIVAIFRRHGFKWGGDWKGQGRDPMHFQFCTGY